MSGTRATGIAGTYYDGRSAAAHAVLLEVVDGTVGIRGEGVDLRLPLAGIRVSERLGAVPRTLQLPDGASVVLAATSDVSIFEGEQFRASDLLAWLESRWTVVLASLALVVAALVAVYMWGLPAAADAIADRLPERAAAGAGDQTLQMLDKNFLQPSALSAARTDAILQRLARMKQPGDAVSQYQVMFRASDKLGANAFALPNGKIVVTDALVALAENDDEVLAVIGHEIGHVQRRHLLRQILRGSLLAVFMTWWTGDFGSTAVMLSTAFLETGYSRDFEREADDYAVQFLRANGLSPILLGHMLERLEASHKGSAAPAYLSTHPSTRERIERLQRGT